MKKLICALIGAASLVASATTYIQTSATGTAPWRPVKDSVSQAHLADSARVAWFAHAATYADSSRVSGLSDSAKRAETASWTPLSDSSLASGIADSAKKAGTTSNSLALGGIAASQYGTLAQDTLIAKKVASDTATVLRAGIASAITTSESYATARISDSLSANTRAWTTLAAAKSSIHDSLTVERTFDTTASRNIAHDTATSLRTYVGSASTTGNAATATKLATARTISMTGDGEWSTSFDGSANATGPLHLARLLASGSAGSASSAPTLTWDTTGRLTSVGSAAISVPHGQISDWGTYINQAVLTTSSPTFAGSTMSNLVLVGTEPNNITNVQLANSVITTNPPTSLASQRQGLQFNWYSSNYVLGIIRGNGTDDQGFGITYGGGSNLRWRCTNGTTYDYNALTVSGLITANGGIIGQGNVGSSAQPWNAGYFSTAGIDIGAGLLKIYSPNSALALLGIAAHPISLSTASGAATFPSDLSIGGALGLSVVSVGGTTYSASAHRGRILTIAPSTTFTLPLGSAGDWFIIQSSAAQGPNQSAGVITPSGTKVYIRGVECSSFTSVIGTLVAYCNGVYWYIG